MLFVQKWDDTLCPKVEDYPIFFATMQEPSKDNSGEKIFVRKKDFPNSPPLEGWSETGVVQPKLPEEVVVDQGGKKRNSKNYFELRYNPKLKERAKELRKAGNLSEVLFWNEVKNKQFKGFDFDRQKIIGNYIVDFYCTNCNVVIEIDGSSHDDKQEYDAARDAYLQGLGLTIIHIDDLDVKKKMKEVMNYLYEHPALVESKEPPRLSGTPPEEGNLVAEPIDNYDSTPSNLEEFLLDSHGHLVVKHDLFNHDGLTKTA